MNYGWLQLGQADASSFTRFTNPNAVTYVAFSPDGLALAVADDQGRVWQIDVE